MAFKRTVQKRRIKILLFGPPGSGKTMGAIQAPNPAVFDLEKGTNFYNDVSNFIVEDEKDPLVIIDKIVDLGLNPNIDMGDGEIFNVKTIVVDPIHIWELGLEQKLLARRRKEERNPSYTIQPQDYKSLKQDKKRLMQTLLNVDMNVIINARTKDLYVPGKIMEKAGVGPDCDDQWLGYFDIILMIYFDAKKGNRRMAVVYGKDRTQRLPKTESGVPIPFEWSYKNFEKYLDGLGYDADSDSKVSKESMDKDDGRFFETIYKGTTVKTAGVTGETLEKIAEFYLADSTKDKITKLLKEAAEVDTPYDLTEDMAKFLIEEVLKEETT